MGKPVAVVGASVTDYGAVWARITFARRSGSPPRAYWIPSSL